MRIIALAGRKGSGKSTVKALLQNHPNVNADETNEVSFASPIKRMLAEMGVPEDSLYGDDEQKNVPLPEFGGVTGRHLAVTLGTEWGRNMIHKSIWVMAMALEVKALEEMDAEDGTNSVLIIDDLRFQDELEFLRSKGATIIGIHRGELPGSMLDQHISEQLPYRFAELGIPIIKNDSTLAELHQKVIALAVPNP